MAELHTTQTSPLPEIRSQEPGRPDLHVLVTAARDLDQLTQQLRRVFTDRLEGLQLVEVPAIETGQIEVNVHREKRRSPLALR